MNFPRYQYYEANVLDTTKRPATQKQDCMRLVLTLFIQPARFSAEQIIAGLRSLGMAGRMVGQSFQLIDAVDTGVPCEVIAQSIHAQLCATVHADGRVMFGLVPRRNASTVMADVQEKYVEFWDDLIPDTRADLVATAWKKNHKNYVEEAQRVMRFIHMAYQNDISFTAGSVLMRLDYHPDTEQSYF